MYNALGKTALRFSYRYVKRRYRREIRVGLGVTAAFVAIGAYLASRNVPEG
jgi:hypothetical protein